MKIKNWSTPLIIATIIISVVRYAAAFAASDIGQITGTFSEIVTIALTITGFGMGLLDTAGGGLLFNGWSRVFPKAGQKWTFRFWVLTFCVFSLVISGMVILVPFTVSRVAHESILETLGGKLDGWIWLWSGMVNFIPYVIIAGVFTGNKMVTSLEEGKDDEKVARKSQPEQEQVTETFPKDWRRLRPMLNETDILNLANMIGEQVRNYSKKYNVDERTVINWRKYAREEMPDWVQHASETK